MRPINVLSLFDGISCGQLALKRAGIPVNRYFAAEIDKYAMEVAMKNFPNTIQLYDITSIQYLNGPAPDRSRGIANSRFYYPCNIDLLIGGSPCQGFSFAGKQLNFEDPRSKLFFEYVRILKEIRIYNPNVLFLLENVKMKKEYQDVISEQLGVQPIEINSAKVSAQNRKRLYWTNIPNVTQPEDKDVCLADILEKSVSSEYDHSKKAIEYMNRISPKGRSKWSFRYHSDAKNKKSACVTSNYHKGVPNNVLIDGERIRRFTAIELERLQCLPDNFTSSLSFTQRCKVIGNGWNIDTIVHILKNIL